MVANAMISCNNNNLVDIGMAIHDEAQKILEEWEDSYDNFYPFKPSEPGSTQAFVSANISSLNPGDKA